MSEPYIPKFVSVIDYQNNLVLLLKGRLLYEFILHFYYAAEYSIDSQNTDGDALTYYQTLAAESESKLKLIAAQHLFEEKIAAILSETEDYKYYPLKYPDIFVTIFLRDLELAKTDFVPSFFSSLKGLRFASDKILLQPTTFRT